MKKKTKKVGGKTLALAAFKLWLKKAPKVNYAITHSKTTFIIHKTDNHPIGKI